jgi:GAF domain-containing protein
LLLTKDQKALLPIMSQFSDGHLDRKMWRLFKGAVQPWQVRDAPEEIRQTIVEHRPLFISDAKSSSLPTHWIEPFGVKSVLIVPLISKERAIGLMALDHIEEGREFTAEQVDLAMAVATQAAVATENAQLFQNERKRASQLAVVNQVARQIASILDLEQLLGEIVTSIQQGFNYFHTALFLMDDDTDGKLKLLAMHGGFEHVTAPDYSQAVGEGLIGLAAESGQPILVNDVSQDSRFIAGYLSKDLPKSELCVPIKLVDRVIGVVDMQSTRLNAFDETDLVAMETLADQIAIAIENARLFGEEESSRRLADTLREIAQALNSTLSLGDVLDLILAELEKVIAFESGSIMLLEGKDLIIRAVKGFADPDAVIETHLDLDIAPLNREVVESKRPLIVGAVHQDERWLKPMRAFGLESKLRPIHSWMGIPLIAKSQVIGMLTTDGSEANAYDKRDAEIALTFANQAAVAIETARLFEAEQRRRQEAETLYRAAQALTTTLDLSQVFECILSELQQVVPYDSASVQLLRDQRLEIIGGHGFPNLDELLGTVFDLSEENNPNRKVIHQRAPFIVDDAPAVYSEFRKDPHAAAGIHAWLGVPLLIGDQPVGMLALDKQERGFYTSEHARLASAFAAQAAIAIENARLYEEQRERALQAESLLHIEQAINSSLELDPTLQTIVKMMAQLMDVTQSGIILFDEEYEYGRLTAEYQEVEHTPVEELEISLEGNLSIERVLATREPLAIYDAENDPLLESIRDTIRQRRIKSILIVPLITKGRVIGTIGFDATKAPDVLQKRRSDWARSSLAEPPLPSRTLSFTTRLNERSSSANGRRKRCGRERFAWS